jgi:TPR repeat protein
MLAKAWEAGMKFRSWLPAFAAVFFASCLAAQQNLPASTKERLAAFTQLDRLTRSDFVTLLSEAQSGDSHSQYLLALAYGEGQIIERDLAGARRWMLRSAEQGYVPAEASLGEMYLTNIPHEGAIDGYADADRWLRLAATQGDAHAQFWLGTGYQRGYFGAIDYAEAIGWIQKAAEQGLPDAQFAMGQMCEHGEGVPKRYTLAAKWYEEAADHVGVPPQLGGVNEAKSQMVYMHRFGKLPKYDVDAYMWAAIVDSSLDPPIDDDVRFIARHMKKEQIAQGQRMAEDWIKRHNAQPLDVAQAKQ